MWERGGGGRSAPPAGRDAVVVGPAPARQPGLAGPVSVPVQLQCCIQRGEPRELCRL